MCNTKLKSTHQMEVEQFMRLAKQEFPGKPTSPPTKVRLLRARLILEEAMETISRGLGVDVYFPGSGHGEQPPVGIDDARLEARPFGFNMVELIDGCCDVAVVTTGTLSACGVPDLPFQHAVNQNNLDKFGPGHTLREDGKLLKPPGHKPPNIKGILESIQ